MDEPELLLGSLAAWDPSLAYDRGSACSLLSARSSPKPTVAQPSRILDLSTLNLGVQCWHALIVEWHLSADENVEHDTETPDIDFRASVDFSVEQLGRGKVERTTECREVV